MSVLDDAKKSVWVCGFVGVWVCVSFFFRMSFRMSLRMSLRMNSVRMKFSADESADEFSADEIQCG